MKKVFITTLIFMMLISPISIVSAQSTDRILLLTQIKELLVQLLKLQEQLVSQQAVRVTVVTDRELTQSTFYDGTYEAIYIINGTTLFPYKNTVITQNDQNLWKLFKDVVGEDTVRSFISEFRLYSDRNSEFDAFVELNSNSEGWVVGVNIANIKMETSFQKENVIELFIHEYAHIIYNYNPKTIEKFEEQFWSRQSFETEDFVSDYAMINLGEDFTESFTHFVLRRRPSRETISDKKILFFYDYYIYRDIREDIRDRLFD